LEALQFWKSTMRRTLGGDRLKQCGPALLNQATSALISERANESAK
jgi:hypothetical protein